MILLEVVDTCVSVSFVLAHVGVPSVGEFCELLALNLLNVAKLLILGVFHPAHLSGVLYLAELANLLGGPLCFEVIKLTMALV